MDDLLTFEVARPHRGSIYARDVDGELSLRLLVPVGYLAAVDELANMLGEGGGATARLVVVRE